eukprot:c16060_g1_i1.p2 GENE.c16060_g1_i1~~c16060_g1_i1.p2  ORF type:complete len:179 (+),score=52.98 c16060_g1_i1:46-537(+)
MNSSLQIHSFALLFMLAAVVYVVAHEAHSDSHNNGGNHDMPDFSKLRVAELKKFLADRGVDCVGCSEKSHFVERVIETFHLPIKEFPESSGAKSQDKHAANKDDQIFRGPNGEPIDVQSILAKMKQDEALKHDLLEKLRQQGVPVGEKLRRPAPVRETDHFDL